MRLDYSEGLSKKTLILLLVFPTSFYFAAIYTESLFLFLVLSSFYLCRQKKWWWAALAAMLASAVRITGIFLLPVLLIELVEQQKYVWPQLSQFFTRKNLGKLTKIIFGSPLIYLIPLGLVSYMIYLQVYFNDALYFWHAQEVFGLNANRRHCLKDRWRSCDE